MKNYKLILLSFSVLLLNACAVNQATVNSSKTAVRTSIESNERSLKMLNMMSEQSNVSYRQGKIAESANQEIQTYIIKEKQEIEAQNVALEKSLKELDAPFSITKTTIDNASRAVDESSNTLRILEEKTKVIVDFLGNETFSKSEIGALFKPGEYRLQNEQIAEGEKLFRPIVEKLFTFAEKYKGSFSNLKGEIIVTGYSDATAIDRNSKLYKDLSNQLGVSNANNSQLNQKLSELRADAVKQLLETIISNKKVSNSETLNISVKVLGRGEEVPRGLSENIAKNDFRRRVVTFYWVVLPKL